MEKTIELLRDAAIKLEEFAPTLVRETAARYYFLTMASVAAMVLGTAVLAAVTVALLRHKWDGSERYNMAVSDTTLILVSVTLGCCGLVAMIAGAVQACAYGGMWMAPHLTLLEALRG